MILNTHTSHKTAELKQSLFYMIHNTLLWSQLTFVRTSHWSICSSYFFVPTEVKGTPPYNNNSVLKTLIHDAHTGYLKARYHLCVFVW